MRRSLCASGTLHAGLVLWVAFGGTLFDRSPDTEFEVTGVTLMSVQEFEALTGAGPSAEPAVLEQPTAPALPEITDAPEAPAADPFADL